MIVQVCSWSIFLFLTDWCETGGAAGKDDTIQRTITADGSRIMFCRTSASWACSTSTWRWVRYSSALWALGFLEWVQKSQLAHWCLSIFFCLNTQWSSLASSLCSWPPSLWLHSWLFSTTSLKSGWMLGSSPHSSGDRWPPRPEILVPGRRSLTLWPFCPLSPTWVCPFKLIKYV